MARARTLLDRNRSPARAIAAAPERRWSVETDRARRKAALGMGVLKSRTADGVRQGVLVLGLAYNLVRRVLRAAAGRPDVGVERIGFADAWRWLRQAKPGATLPELVVPPGGPGGSARRSRSGGRRRTRG